VRSSIDERGQRGRVSTSEGSEVEYRRARAARSSIDERGQLIKLNYSFYV
jgi:hypothetical protein